MPDNLPDKPNHELLKSLSHEELTYHFEQWLLTDLRPILLQNKQQPTIDLKLLYNQIMPADKRYRRWRAQQIESLQLKPDIDFTVASQNRTQPQGGNQEDVYLVTFDAARRIAAASRTPIGNAMVQAMINITNRIARGDPVVASIIAVNMEDPQSVFIPAFQREWLHHYGRTIPPLENAIREKFGKGFWAPYIQTGAKILMVEEVIHKHFVGTNAADRERTSLTGCWSRHRNGQTWAGGEFEIRVALDDGKSIYSRVYQFAELIEYMDWVPRYFDKLLGGYLKRNHNYSGQVPAVTLNSIHEASSIAIAGHPAVLGPLERKRLDKLGGFVPLMPPAQAPTLSAPTPLALPAPQRSDDHPRFEDAHLPEE